VSDLRDQSVRLRMTPLLLGYAVNPPIMAALWLLSRWGLVAAQPLWVYCVVLWGGAVLGTVAELWFRRNPSTASRHARAAAMTIATGAAIYTTGWGPVLAIAYAFGAQELMGRHGAAAWRMTTCWTVASMTAGQLAVALGVAPLLLPETLAHGLAALEGIGAVILIRMMGAVTELKEEAEASLREREERYRSLVQNASDVTLVLDADGTVMYASEACEVMLGRRPDELVGRPARQFAAEEDVLLLRPRLRVDLAEAGASRLVELRVRHADGSLRDVEAVVANLCDRPSVGGFVVNARDVTARKRAEAALAHQALHDALTGLPNRPLLIDRLEQALARAARTPSCGPAVMFLDLDRFKLVNDGLGHDAGDELLVAVAERLRASIRPEDTVARFGGDEFIVLCDRISCSDQVQAVAQRISRCFASPFTVRGEELQISASIGLVVHDGIDDVPTMLRHADAAMYQAKAVGPGRIQVFDSSTRDDALQRMHAETALRAAFDAGELRVHYQPIFGLDELEVVGVEALVRWEHPTRGLLPPAEFLEVAEASGLIVPIGSWVLCEASQQVRTWNAGTSSRPLSLSVNMSASQLAEADLVEKVRRALVGGDGTPALDLVLEVTETLLVDDARGAADRLAEIRQLGVKVAIDDFGTGYSSLSYLRRLPVDVLKIDRTFVAGLGEGGTDDAIVRSVIGLAHDLGLQCVAEGVETDAQLTCLRALGCDAAQGFLLGRPQSPADVSFAPKALAGLPVAST